MFNYNSSISHILSIILSRSTKLSYTSKAKFIITKFEPEGDIALIEGIIKDKYFEGQLMPGTMLIKENGRWKWYGNQVQK